LFVFHLILFHLHDLFFRSVVQVAIKIIDKTQLNPNSLQKVRLVPCFPLTVIVFNLVILQILKSYIIYHNIILNLFFLSSLQLFREVRIMKMLDHPNIGEFPCLMRR
jgi:hypothetical protein